MNELMVVPLWFDFYEIRNKQLSQETKKPWIPTVFPNMHQMTALMIEVGNNSRGGGLGGVRDKRI